MFMSLIILGYWNARVYCIYIDFVHNHMKIQTLFCCYLRWVYLQSALVKEENYLEPRIWALPPPFGFFLNFTEPNWIQNNSNATKTNNTEDIEEYQEEKVMSINKHQLSKNITKHCKNGAPSVTLSLFFSGALPQHPAGVGGLGLAWGFLRVGLRLSWGFIGVCARVGLGLIQVWFRVYSGLV